MTLKQRCLNIFLHAFNATIIQSNITGTHLTGKDRTVDAKASAGVPRTMLDVLQEE